jgi:type II secretory pathway component PulJ
MSELPETAGRVRQPGSRADRGSTLPELVVTVMILGLVTASLSAALIVMFRQQDNTEGRLNVARAEQNVGMWLPADLASAEEVDVSPGASPCGVTCPGDQTIGSNAVMLTWDSMEAGDTEATATQTNVSYRYAEVDGDWRLLRVQCVSLAGDAWSCTTQTVLTDLDPPPAGTEWEPGITSPSWVILVSEPLDPEDTGSPSSTVPVDPTAPTKNAKRVVVTIDGGGDAEGAGGGVNVISLSAGGTSREVIDAASVAGTPSFNEARTRCGGSYGLIIDQSGSIGGAMPNVRAGVIDFVRAFAGTPMRLQVVRFATTGAVIGSADTRYYDMLNPADVNDLIAQLGTINAGGGTNWEDALHRMFLDGSGAIQQTVPDKVVFFTDGEPNGHRRSSTSRPTAPREPPVATPLLNGFQESFDRAKFLVDRFRADVDFIGVGVGPAFNSPNNWRSVGPGWHYDYFRGYHHQKRDTTAGPWYQVTKAVYDATPPADRRFNYAAPYEFWEPTTLAVYNTLPSAGRQRTKDYSAPFEQYDIILTPTTNRIVLTRLITGNDTGVVAESVGGRYINADVANMYILPEWSQFAAALEAVALAECGGTVTLQTKVGSTAAADPFTYQHSGSTNPAGAPLTPSMDVVTTTKTFPSGTFDFSIPDGEFVTVEIRPVELSLLTRYSPVSWSCTAGGAAKPVTTFPITGTPWSGIRVQVRANEAVSCIQAVDRI